MSGVKIYRSTDASAPVLTGEAGKFIALLDACLVNGYGTKAAAGWTKQYAGSNTASYKQGNVIVGTPPIQYYLDVDDSGPGAGGARDGRVRGYELMTSVGVGTNAFPATGTNICVRKSGTLDTTARAWKIFADETTVMIFVNAAADGIWRSFYFGEIYSYVTGDSYKNVIIGNSENNTSGQTVGGMNNFASAGPGGSLATAHYVARTYAGLNIGSQGLKFAWHNMNGQTGSGRSTYTWTMPDPRTGAFVIIPVIMCSGSATTAPHGEARGYFFTPHPSTGYADGDTFTGTGVYAGRTFEVVKSTDSGGAFTDIALVVETSATWARSN